MPENVGSGDLTVTFLDEPIHLDPATSLRFGRQGDLVVDENPFMHRVLGRFVHREGFWWLQNHGSRTVLTLTDADSQSQTVVAPGQQSPIVAANFLLTFTCGPSNYELEGHQHVGSGDSDAPRFPLGTATMDFGVVPFSNEQHLLLVALCEPRLTGSTASPTNQATAARIGWTITKFNRKLDAICIKLARQGVRGLRGSPDSLALDRRTVLIDHALQARLVTQDDLGLLPGEGRPASEG